MSRALPQSTHPCPAAYRGLARKVLLECGGQRNGHHHGTRIPLLRLLSHVDGLSGEVLETRQEAAQRGVLLHARAGVRSVALAKTFWILALISRAGRGRRSQSSLVSRQRPCLLVGSGGVAPIVPALPPRGTEQRLRGTPQQLAAATSSEIPFVCRIGTQPPVDSRAPEFRQGSRRHVLPSDLRTAKAAPPAPSSLLLPRSGLKGQALLPKEVALT